MAKILLTGSAGMLGSALREVLARGHEVLALGKSELDITDSKAVEEKIAELKPDVVVNAAAYTAVDACEEQEELATQINGEAVGYLAAACQQSGAKLIHFSTDYVFDGENAKGYAEDAPPNPVNAYGRSKLAGEQAILKSGCEFVIIRTSWLYGPNGKNFVKTMLELGQKQTEVKVVADQTGCPTYTVELAEAVGGLVASGETGIYHLTNTSSTTWADFATEIFRLADLNAKVMPIKTAEYPRPAARPTCSVLVNTKRPPLRPWQAALAEYLARAAD